MKDLCERCLANILDTNAWNGRELELCSDCKDEVIKTFLEIKKTKRMETYEEPLRTIVPPPTPIAFLESEIDTINNQLDTLCLRVANIEEKMNIKHRPCW